MLDILVQDRRDRNAAKRFLRRLLKGLQYVPRVIVTDKLRSYGVAQRHLLPGVEHRQSRYRNNRAENSHRPPRRRERQMQRFKSPEQARTFSPPTRSPMATSIRADTDLQPTPILRWRLMHRARIEMKAISMNVTMPRPKQLGEPPHASGRRPLTATMTGVDRAHRGEASLWLCQQWNRRK